MEEKQKYIVEARKPLGGQEDYFCPYCKKKLFYLWSTNGEIQRLIGIGLSRWVYCNKCKRKFKLDVWGIKELDFDPECDLIINKIEGKESNE